MNELVVKFRGEVNFDELRNSIETSHTNGLRNKSTEWSDKNPSQLILLTKNEPSVTLHFYDAQQRS